ncbi:unnamed protein product [Calypogeia fissa]
MPGPKGGHKIITKSAVLGALPLLSPTPEPNTMRRKSPTRSPMGYSIIIENAALAGRYSLRSSFLPVFFQGVHFPQQTFFQ